MRVLIDTHALLWWINNDPRISWRAREVFSAGENKLLFSAASGWEMAIKVNLGKLTVEGPLGSYLSKHLVDVAVEVLPVSLRHAVGVADLPNHHRDPFDRLIVAQALAEGIPVLTADPLVTRYPVETIW